MHLTREIAGSVGAGLCLVGAAVAALFAFSAFVAVKGWPDVAVERGSEPVRLSAVPAAVDDAPRGAPGADTAALADAAAAPVTLRGGGDRASVSSTSRATVRPARAERGGRTHSAASRGDAGVAAPAPEAVVAGTRPVTVPAAGEQHTVLPAAPAAPSAPASPPTPASGPVERTVDAVAAPVQATVETVERAPSTVQGAGRAVRQAAVIDATGAVREATDAASGLLGR